LSHAAEPGAYWPLRSADLSQLRVGYTEDFGTCIVDAEIRRTFRRKVDMIRPLVGACEPLDLKLGDADGTFDVLRAEAFLAAYADTYETARETLGPNVLANIEMAATISLADRARAHLQQTHIAREFAQAFERYDIVLAPTTPVSPFPWTELFAREIDGQAMRNYYHWLALTYVVTLATNPALSLPCGRDEHGMPFGLQMIGRLRGDGELLQAARALEEALAGDPQTARPQVDFSQLEQARPELRSIVTHPPLADGGNAAGARAPV
jgi:amidase